MPDNYCGTHLVAQTLSIAHQKGENESHVKPVGNLSATVGDWSHSVVKTGHDNTACGWWSYITFALKEEKFITLVPAYRVCDQTSPGNTTASAQQCKIQ
jgi:hypothetical protein